MADRFENTPGIVSTFEDGGLQFAKQVDLGDRLVIMGTAGSGPLNEPVGFSSLSEAKRIWGAYGDGSLVRGLYESFGATAVSKDIVGVRVGNATKATLGLAEASASGSTTADYDQATKEADGTMIQDAFTLIAKKEGDEYNNATVRMDYVSGVLSVVIYNPITGVESGYTYNPDPNAYAQVHNVKELVDAINADPSLNEDFVADYKDLSVGFEVKLMSSGHVYASGVSISGENVRVELRTRLDTRIVGTDPVNSPYPTGVQAVDDLYATYAPNFTSVGNRIIDVQSVYQIAIASGVLIESQGKGSLELDDVPYKATGNTYIGQLNASNFTSAQAKQRVVNGFLGVVEDTAVTIYAWDSSVNVDAATFILYKSQGGVKSVVTASTYVLTATAGATKVTFNSSSVVPDVGTILYFDYNSAVFALTEVATRSAVLATVDWKQYFVSGTTLTFGAAPPTDLYITYKYKKYFPLGGGVVLENPEKGTFLFPDTDLSPKADLLAATAGSPALFGFLYSYQPEWVAIGFGAVALKGGSDGIVMTIAEKYDAMTKTYEALEDYDADIFVPMGCYLDDTKDSYNEETGLIQTENAGFHTQLDEFLVGLSEGVNEAIGLISIKQASGNDLAAVKDWHTKATVTSTSDPTRAANIMTLFSSKHVSVLAGEPVFSNTEVTIPYSTTGEAVYAGLIAGLKPGSSPTNKRVDNVIGMRYRLSRGQVDSLIGMRYVTFRRSNGSVPGIVVADGVTAAAPGSDYVRLTTVRGAFAAMDMIRQVASPFLGEPSDEIGTAAVETAIRKGLQGMIDARDIRDFAFQIKTTLQQMVQGIMDVELLLVPQFEIRKIRVTVKIRPSL